MVMGNKCFPCLGKKAEGFVTMCRCDCQPLDPPAHIAMQALSAGRGFVSRTRLCQLDVPKLLWQALHCLVCFCMKRQAHKSTQWRPRYAALRSAELAPTFMASTMRGTALLAESEVP